MDATDDVTDAADGVTDVTDATHDVTDVTDAADGVTNVKDDVTNSTDEVSDDMTNVKDVHKGGASDAPDASTGTCASISFRSIPAACLSLASFVLPDCPEEEPEQIPDSSPSNKSDY